MAKRYDGIPKCKAAKKTEKIFGHKIIKINRILKKYELRNIFIYMKL